MISKEMYELHLKAGLICGKEHTCRDKVDYKTEETAKKSAEKMTIKFNKNLEPYPCAFCNGWHIGRTMSEEELKEIVNREG